MIKTKTQAVKMYKTIPLKGKHLWIYLNFDKLFDMYGDEMPYGTMKARDGDPMEWIDNKLAKSATKSKRK